MRELFLLSSLVTLSGAVARIPDLHDDRDDGHSGFLVIRWLWERLAGHWRGQVSCKAELCCTQRCPREGFSHKGWKYFTFCELKLKCLPFFCYSDFVIQCRTAAKSESTPHLCHSTSIRMNLSLTKVSTCSTEPSLQRAVSKIWCLLQHVRSTWGHIYAKESTLLPVSTCFLSISSLSSAISLWRWTLYPSEEGVWWGERLLRWTGRG